MLQQRLFKLTDGTYLETYYGRDAHGSVSQNWCHLDSNLLFIQLFLHKTRIVERLFGMVSQNQSL